MNSSLLNKHKLSIILARLEDYNLTVIIKKRSSLDTYRGYTGRKNLIKKVLLCSKERANELEFKSRGLADLFDYLTQIEKDRVYNYEYIYIQFTTINNA